MSGVLVIAEMSGEQLPPTTTELVAEGGRLAKQLSSGPLTALLIGNNIQGVAPTLGQIGVERVLVADSQGSLPPPPQWTLAAAEKAARQVEPVSVDAEDLDKTVQVLEEVREQTTSGPRLKDAKVIVSGGRGLGGPENWHFVEELARVLGAAVGATRAVTDAGWVPSSLQVGLTGATIAPDLYITVGISGAVQHIAGISGARNVVAINRDADANIFKYARYGVIGDWKQIVPAFTQRLKELRG